MGLRKTLEQVRDTAGEEHPDPDEGVLQEDTRGDAASLGLGYHGIFSMRDTQGLEAGSEGTLSAPDADDGALPASEAPRGGSTTLPASEDANQRTGT